MKYQPKQDPKDPSDPWFKMKHQAKSSLRIFRVLSRLKNKMDTNKMELEVD